LRPTDFPIAVLWRVNTPLYAPACERTANKKKNSARDRHAKSKRSRAILGNERERRKRRKRAKREKRERERERERKRERERR